LRALVRAHVPERDRSIGKRYFLELFVTTGAPRLVSSQLDFFLDEGDRADRLKEIHVSLFFAPNELFALAGRTSSI